MDEDIEVNMHSEGITKAEWDEFVADFSLNQNEYANEIIEEFVTFMSEEPGKTEASKLKKNCDVPGSPCRAQRPRS